MGGTGSGRRWGHGGRPTTAGFHELDVRYLARMGVFASGGTLTIQWTENGKKCASIKVISAPGFDIIVLRYRWRTGGTWKDEEIPVSFTRTLCPFGGHRFWFVCPGDGCGRRVAILYGGKVFVCRHCIQAVYQSQRETVANRARIKAQKTRKRLGWKPAIGSPWGDKPKWMHWRTFGLLLKELEECYGAWLQGIGGNIGLSDFG